MPCLIVSCFVLLVCLLDTFSFLKENGDGVCLGEREGRGYLAGMVGIYCMGEEFIFNLNKKKYKTGNGLGK